MCLRSNFCPKKPLRLSQILSMHCAWMLWSSYALRTRTFSWLGHGCSGHRMLLEHERFYGLGTDALVTGMLFEHQRYFMVWARMLWSPVCSSNTNAIMVWARMLWSPVCSSNTNVIMVWARMLWSSYALRTRTLLWFGHGCSGHRMLFEHERYYGLGTDALVIVCSWSTNVIMVWARMLWSSYALGARALLWFGHGCSGHRMLLAHERYSPRHPASGRSDPFKNPLYSPLQTRPPPPPC